MRKIFSSLVFFIIFFTLSACATTQPKTSEEEAKATKLAQINIQLGLKYIELKNFQRAKQKLLAALEANPKLPETQYVLAYFYETMGDTQLANQYYLASVSLAPNRGDVQNNYGTFLCRLGQYKNAVQHFQQAVKDNSYLNVAGAYENAGLCALKIPDRKMAAHYFELALKHDPGRTTALREWRALA